jgi:hypothetical protein
MVLAPSAESIYIATKIPCGFSVIFIILSDEMPARTVSHDSSDFET